MTDDRNANANAAANANPAAEAASEQLVEQLSADVRASLASALARLLGDTEAADQALADSACLLDGGTLAWRIDTGSLVVELFCDVGLPAPGYVEAAYRQVLEANLCRHYPGVYTGVHPESGRLVATSAPPAVLMLDADFCEPALQNLAAHARHLREALGLSLCAPGMDVHWHRDDALSSSGFGRGHGGGLA